MELREKVKKLTVTLRSVDYSTYEIEVEEDYAPETGEQIIEDFFLMGNDQHNLINSEVNDETVEDWEIN
jgi:hypothetical protein